MPVTEIDLNRDSQSQISKPAAKRRIYDAKGKTCFVIMPFGIKTSSFDPDKVIDLDGVYQAIIKPAAEALGLKCKRSDEVNESGLIHRDMIDRIITSDVVIVDVSTYNPNVFYELGIRHTARRSGTILVRMQGERIPFNINGMRVLEYDLKQIEYSRNVLLQSIIESMAHRNIDSLVHTLLPGLNVTRRPLPIETTELTEYATPRLKRTTFGIVTGDIMKVDFVDVWVNPENTKMQMARWHDGSISANIRYYGARRDKSGRVRHDTIASELSERLGDIGAVEAGTVIATGPGELGRTNGVKIVLHVAGLHGEPGKGYLPIRSYADCTSQALKEIDRLNGGSNGRGSRRAPLTSVLFPLFGTRSGERDPQEVTDRLVRAAVSHFEPRRVSLIEHVYFLAYTDADRELCEAAFSRCGLKKHGRKKTVTKSREVPTRTAPESGTANGGMKKAAAHRRGAMPPKPQSGR
jgi:O-acetyl-ADP-ribose deacetylase (regulator of RNase III)